MKIIALRGRGGCGKTTTLGLVHNNLKHKAYIEDVYELISNGDFKAILRNKSGHVIGIVTQGDYAIGNCSVKKHLEWCKSKKCDIVICACTVGPNKNKIEEYIKSYLDHKFIDKTIELDISKQNAINIADAATIESYL